MDRPFLGHPMCDSFNLAAWQPLVLEGLMSGNLTASAVPCRWPKYTPNPELKIITLQMATYVLNANGLQKIQLCNLLYPPKTETRNPKL